MTILLIKALVGFKNEINDNTLTKNEKTFIFSLGFNFHTVLNNNKINVFEEYYVLNFGKKYDSLITSYVEDNVNYLIEIYDALEEKIFIEKILNDMIDGKNKRFNYVKEPLKMFYKEFLTEEEKLHIITLVNELPKNFLQDVLSFNVIRLNIRELFDLFDLMYFITDGRFRYNENVANDLLSRNKYNIRKVFFKHLRDELITYQKDATFFNNMKELLIKASEDFNAYMTEILKKDKN